MNKKILIVRGDERQSKTLSFLLAGTGFRTRSFTCGKKALAAVGKGNFDLVITDRNVPENKDELSFVAKLKEAMPDLPILLVTDKKELEEIIFSIRTGVTDIIDGGDDLKTVFQKTHKFVSEWDQSGYDVGEEDLAEVEEVLNALNLQKSSNKAEDESDAQNSEQKEKLSSLEDEVSTLKSEYAALEQSKTKLQDLLAEFEKEGAANGGTSAKTLQREAEIDLREAKMAETMNRFSKQRAEFEVKISELEDLKYLIDEQQAKGYGPNGDTAQYEEELKQLRQDKDHSLQKFNEKRLELEAKIHDLSRELEVSKNKGQSINKMETQIFDLRSELQDTKEKIAEKDFVIKQRDSQLEKIQDVEATAPHPEVEEIEEAKRLFEIEKFKLQEKLDRFEMDRRDFDRDHEKNRRELQVERKDAEISLREMQTQIKEDQLNLHVESATFQDERRQFQQAKQNFQEDIQDLQQRQSELKSYEEKLKQYEQDMGSSSNSALPESPEAMNEMSELREIPAKSNTNEENASSRSDLGINAEPKQQPKDPNEDNKKPDTWGKPPEAQKGVRGPLRIGRRSSF